MRGRAEGRVAGARTVIAFEHVVVRSHFYGVDRPGGRHRVYLLREILQGRSAPAEYCVGGPTGEVVPPTVARAQHTELVVEDEEHQIRFVVGVAQALGESPGFDGLSQVRRNFEVLSVTVLLKPNVQPDVASVEVSLGVAKRAVQQGLAKK